MDENYANNIEKLSDIFEERQFNKVETNFLLISPHDKIERMIKLLENNPKITEEQFLKEMED